jgi:hypothetical protein
MGGSGARRAVATKSRTTDPTLTPQLGGQWTQSWEGQSSGRATTTKNERSRLVVTEGLTYDPTTRHRAGRREEPSDGRVSARRAVCPGGKRS